MTAKIRKQNRAGRVLRRQVSRSLQRTAFTHVATICDCAEIQQIIPQILIVNSKTMSEQVYAKLISSLPPNIKLWRRKSSWMDIDTPCEVVRAQAKAVLPYKDTHRVLLGLDAARIHLNEKVWRQAARSRIFMYVVAAKITWAMQPCDVYVFAAYKWKLRCASQQMAIARNNSEVSLEQTILAVVKAVEAVISGRCWKHAFEHLGLNGSQAAVSETTLKKLGLSHTPQVGSSMLTLVELQSCFPRGSIIPTDAVFKLVSSVLAPSAAADPREAEQPPAPVVFEPWIGRTRSSAQLDAARGSVAPPALAPPARAAALGSWRPMLRLRRLPSAPMGDVAPPPLPPPVG